MPLYEQRSPVDAHAAKHLVSVQMISEYLQRGDFAFANDPVSISLFNQRLSGESIAKLCEAINLIRGLYALDLGSNCLGDDAVNSISEALAAARPPLTSINLGGNCISDTGASALATFISQCKTLTTINLRFNNIGSSGMGFLADALSAQGNVAHINLSANRVGPEGGVALGKALGNNNALTHLDLFGNELEDMGAVALCHALSSSRSLTFLNLWCNFLGPRTADALSEMLIRNVPVRELQLGSNQLGNSGVRSLSRGIEASTTLTSLDLGDNNIDDDGVVALAEVLSGNQTLQSLVLRNNLIRREGCIHLAEVLKTHPRLRSLNLGGNEVNKEDCQQVQKILYGNTVLTQLVMFPRTTPPTAPIQKLNLDQRSTPQSNKLSATAPVARSVVMQPPATVRSLSATDTAGMLSYRPQPYTPGGQLQRIPLRNSPRETPESRLAKLRAEQQQWEEEQQQQLSQRRTPSSSSRSRSAPRRGLTATVSPARSMSPTKSSYAKTYAQRMASSGSPRASGFGSPAAPWQRPWTDWLPGSPMHQQQPAQQQHRKQQHQSKPLAQSTPPSGTVERELSPAQPPFVSRGPIDRSGPLAPRRDGDSRPVSNGHVPASRVNQLATTGAQHVPSPTGLIKPEPPGSPRTNEEELTPLQRLAASVEDPPEQLAPDDGIEPVPDPTQAGENTGGYQPSPKYYEFRYQLQMQSSSMVTQSIHTVREQSQPASSQQEQKVPTESQPRVSEPPSPSILPQKANQHNDSVVQTSPVLQQVEQQIQQQVQRKVEQHMKQVSPVLDFVEPSQETRNDHLAVTTAPAPPSVPSQPPTRAPTSEPTRTTAPTVPSAGSTIAPPTVPMQSTTAVSTTPSPPAVAPVTVAPPPPPASTAASGAVSSDNTATPAPLPFNLAPLQQLLEGVKNSLAGTMHQATMKQLMDQLSAIAAAVPVAQESLPAPPQPSQQQPQQQQQQEDVPRPVRAAPVVPPLALRHVRNESASTTLLRSPTDARESGASSALPLVAESPIMRAEQFGQALEQFSLQSMQPPPSNKAAPAPAVPEVAADKDHPPANGNVPGAEERSDVVEPAVPLASTAMVDAQQQHEEELKRLKEIRDERIRELHQLQQARTAITDQGAMAELSTPPEPIAQVATAAPDRVVAPAPVRPDVGVPAVYTDLRRAPREEPVQEVIPTIPPLPTADRTVPRGMPAPPADAPPPSVVPQPVSRAETTPSPPAPAFPPTSAAAAAKLASEAASIAEQEAEQRARAARDRAALHAEAARQTVLEHSTVHEQAVDRERKAVQQILGKEEPEPEVTVPGLTPTQPVEAVRRDTTPEDRTQTTPAPVPAPDSAPPAAAAPATDLKPQPPLTRESSPEVVITDTTITATEPTAATAAAEAPAAEAPATVTEATVAPAAEQGAADEQRQLALEREKRLELEQQLAAERAAAALREQQQREETLRLQRELEAERLREHTERERLSTEQKTQQQQQQEQEQRQPQQQQPGQRPVSSQPTHTVSAPQTDEEIDLPENKKLLYGAMYTNSLQRRMSISSFDTRSRTHSMQSLSQKQVTTLNKALEKGTAEFPARTILPGKKSKENVIITLTSTQLVVSVKKLFGKNQTVSVYPIKPTMTTVVDQTHPRGFLLHSPDLNEPVFFTSKQRDLLMATLQHFVDSAAEMAPISLQGSDLGIGMIDTVSQISEAPPALPDARRVKVLFPFAPEDERMLTIAAGDILDIVGEEDGWLVGYNVQTGEEGFVPPDFVEDVI